MLQIIGWMGCLYLVVKAFELFSAAKHRGKPPVLDTAATIGGALALISAVVFFFMLNAQVDASPY